MIFNRTFDAPLSVGKNDNALNAPWMTIFADMLSLLLTFFVLLYSMSDIPKSSWEYVSNSLTQALRPNAVIEDVKPADSKTVGRVIRRQATNLQYLYAIIQNNTKQQIEDGDVLVDLRANKVIISTKSYNIDDYNKEILLLIADSIDSLSNQIDVRIDLTISDFDDVKKNTKLQGEALTLAKEVTSIIRGAGYRNDPALLIKQMQGAVDKRGKVKINIVIHSYLADTITRKIPIILGGEN